MEKLKMHTPDLAEENYKKLAALFPNAVTETTDENGNVVRAIDKDVLMQEINAQVVDDGQERYQFSWPDKRKSVVLANAPIAKTLRFEKEKSVGRDGTAGGTDSENIYIEGDNLDALKLLQETYLGKVKMIYIDPPYNTGNDFIYEDDFSKSAADYENDSGQTDEEGNRLVQNSESNGRFHTDWLNMIYPRLKIAKDLLSEDGLILISIDESEQANLTKMCDEIFGAKQHITTFIWNNDGHTDNQYDIKINHEYILCYARDLDKVGIGYVVDPNTRKESNLWKGYAENSITKNGPANPASRIMLKPGFPCAASELNLDANKPSKEFYEEVNNTGYITREITQKYNLSYPIRENEIHVSNGKLLNNAYVFSGWANANKLKQFIENGYIPINDKDGVIAFYLSNNGVIYYKKERTKARNIVSVLRNFGTTEQMRSQLEKESIFFDYPKPLDLMKYLINIGAEPENSLVVDFFSGSATTAEAIIKINAEKKTNRKYILIQIPENTNEKTMANKAGYKTICDIGEERIRRAGKKIKEETGADIDYGFRCFKVDSSNMKDVYYRPADIGQMDLDQFTDNIKEDRTLEDLLIQVMLDLGVLLSSKVEQTEIAGKKVFSVADGYLIACFDQDVTDEVVTAIAKRHPFYAVFRDSSMASDSVAANFEQIFDTYSPQTVRKVL